MTVSGQEMRTFQDYWIYEGGHVVIEVSFQFNRKRNIIELEAKQDIEQGNGRMRWEFNLFFYKLKFPKEMLHDILKSAFSYFS